MYNVGNVVSFFPFSIFHLLYRVNSPNSGCLLNIGNRPQSGLPLYNKAKGREAANQFIMGPKAAMWLIIV